MARFAGKVGYSTGSVEGVPGVFSNDVVEFSYLGDIVRNSRQLQDGQKVNPDLSVSNSISIVADAYAMQNFFAIRYVEWMGTKWSVSNVLVQVPRLILQLGEVYNGPTS